MAGVNRTLILDQLHAFHNALVRERKISETEHRQAIRRGSDRIAYRTLGEVAGLERALWILRTTILSQENEVLHPTSRATRSEAKGRQLP